MPCTAVRLTATFIAACTQPATGAAFRGEQTSTRNTILSYVPFEQAFAFTADHDTPSFLPNTPNFSIETILYTSEPTRHADVPFFFYYVIETLAALLRADLIYYPCDCTELLITELRQLRRTTYTFVHASYLSATHSSQLTFFPTRSFRCQ